MRARDDSRISLPGMGEDTSQNTTNAMEINSFGQDDGLVSALWLSTVLPAFDG